MTNIYFSEANEQEFTLIGTYPTQQEAIKAGISYVKDRGYSPGKIWGGWTDEQGRNWHDFGSWHSYLVDEEINND